MSDNVKAHELNSMVQYVRSQMNYIHSESVEKLLNADIDLKLRS